MYSLDSHPTTIVERLVEYFYTGDYSDMSAGAKDTTNDVNMLSVHAKMCIMAEKYGIQGLADLSTAKYGRALQNIRDMKCFLASLKHVYQSSKTSQFGSSSSNDGPCLRDWAVAFARDRLPAHLSDAKFKRSSTDT